MENIRDIKREKALKCLLGYRKAGVEMTVGFGKTLLALEHMMQLGYNNKKFLVVIPRLILIQNWHDEIDKHNLSMLKNHIDFSTYRSLHKQDINKYYAVYLDECHFLLKTHEPWLSAYKGIIIGMTGTWPNNVASEKGYMAYTYCPLIYVYKTDAAIDDNLLNDYRITVYKIELGNKKNLLIKSKNRQWYTSEIANYNYWTNRLNGIMQPNTIKMCRIMRMKAMQSYLSKEFFTRQLIKENPNDKIIIFANTTDQANRLSYHSYHSKNNLSKENLEKFKSGEIKVLSAVNQLSQGVNIPNLNMGIILHAYGNNRQSQQRIGRLLRLNPSECAKAIILCYKNTIDEEWVKKALANYDKSKIKYYETDKITTI